MLTRITNVLHRFENSDNYHLVSIVKKLIRMIDNIKMLKAVFLFDKSKKIVIVGVTKKSIHYAKLIEKKHEIWGICCISAEPEIEAKKLRDYNEILYEDTESFEILLFEKFYVIKDIGVLHEFGVSDSQIHIMDDDFSRGGKIFDTYDVNIGLCWETKLPGFEVFEGSKDKDKAISIVTLGGSTSEPYLCNIKSWSEFLWRMLNDMGINCRIMAGGVSAYGVTQEWGKLYRDVITLKPDMVISYSGVNDLLGDYYAPESHFSVKYMAANTIKDIQKNRISNVVATKNIIHKYSFGVKENSDKPEHWIKCQNMMQCVCERFDIEYLGILQAYNDTKAQSDTDYYMADDAMRERYNKAKQLVLDQNKEWLIDMTEILKGREDLFWDRCHVYEKGNEIIAKNILNYVLPCIEKIQLKNETTRG